MTPGTWQAVRVRSHGLPGGVVGAACPDRNAASGSLDRDANDAQPLFFIQRWRFAGRAAGYEEVDAAFDLPIHQRMQRKFVQAAVSAKRSDQRSSTPSKFHNTWSLSPGESGRSVLCATAGGCEKTISLATRIAARLEGATSGCPTPASVAWRAVVLREHWVP